MLSTIALEEWGLFRRVFETWSIVIPVGFVETFVRENNYWHAYGESRSVSLTSMVITDGERPVTVAELLGVMKPVGGEGVHDLPAGLTGWAVTADAPQPARASRMLQGMLFIEGRVLIVTITADDLDWARQVWLSIRTEPDCLWPLARWDSVAA